MITLKDKAEFEETIKKSRFICRAVRTDTVEFAMDQIQTLSDPDATHNAWAYRIGPISRYNDDGEVSGTAGKPILSVIERRDIDRITVVVTRYYGGVKLGKGGLIRAYGGTAAGCVESAVLEEVRRRIRFDLTVPFAHSNAIYTFLKKYFFHYREDAFDSSGLIIDLAMDHSEFPAFKSDVADLTAGKASISNISLDSE